MKAWYHGGTLPAKPIVITFDNGYPEQVTFAPHVMARYGWPGVLNEITENHLPPAQIWPIIHRGWEVDSHSLTHPELTTATPAELWAQVHDSRVYLQKTFHIPSNSFCYPSSQLQRGGDRGGQAGWLHQRGHGGRRLRDQRRPVSAAAL